MAPTACNFWRSSYFRSTRRERSCSGRQYAALKKVVRGEGERTVALPHRAACIISLRATRDISNHLSGKEQKAYRKIISNADPGSCHPASKSFLSSSAIKLFARSTRSPTDESASKPPAEEPRGSGLTNHRGRAGLVCLFLGCEKWVVLRPFGCLREEGSDLSVPAGCREDGMNE